MNILDSLLKQVVGELEGAPEEISQAYEDQRKEIGGGEPQLSDITKRLQISSSARLTLICIDAMDEYAAEHRVKFLDSLHQILQKS